jgi:hypothetical protein
MSCSARVSTLHKRKREKILPQNVARTGGVSPGQFSGKRLSGNLLGRLHHCPYDNRCVSFLFNYGYGPRTPVEEEVPGWSFLAWDLKSTANLLALRTLQLQRKDEDYEVISLRLRRVREQAKDHFDTTHVLYTALFEAKEPVLLHNTMREEDISRDQKMYFRWLGPYRIKKAIALKDTYVLEELN